MAHCRFIQSNYPKNSLLLENMSKNISRYLDSYENITLLGDFNVTPEEETYNIYRYFQSWTSDKWTNLLQRKSKLHRSHYHQWKIILKNTCVTVTGISDFHKLAAVSLKSQVLKAPPKTKTYRNYTTFDENRFNQDVKPILDSIEKMD